MAQLLALDNYTTQATCERCGYVWEFPSRQLHGRNYDASLCASCKAKPQRTSGKCRAWEGEVDLDTLQPIRDGKPYMVGIRTCGHSDCVTRSHVVTVESLIAELHDLSYRTGTKKNYKQLMAAVRREGRR